MTEAKLAIDERAAAGAGLGRRGRISDTESAALADAYRLLPGGALGGNALPDDCRFVFAHGRGARFWDMSGNEYIDYCLGSGPLVLGHAHPAVVAAAQAQAGRGMHFFAYLNENAVALARLVGQLVPCAERVRFTNTGSEATFHAIRLARAATGRDKVLKFEGAYHGHHDYAQFSTTPRSAAAFPHGEPDTAGIPRAVSDLMLVAPYNDIKATRDIIAAQAEDVAAIIVEPIQRIISPQPGFLDGLRRLADEHGIVLIFDEVVTGFRLGLGGAQQHFGVRPDLCTLGKIIGGGSPLGAVTGRAAIMDQCDPRRKGEPGYVYQNGTLQGNPLSTAIALATIGELRKPGVYEHLFRQCATLREAITDVLRRHAVPAICFGDGPMWHILFTDKVPTNHRDVMAADKDALMRFDYEMIRHGLFVLPGNRRFISVAHDDDDIQDTVAALDAACRAFMA